MKIRIRNRLITRTQVLILTHVDQMNIDVSIKPTPSIFVEYIPELCKKRIELTGVKNFVSHLQTD